MHFFIFLFVAGLLFDPSFVFAKKANWSLAFSRDDIKVYKRNHGDSSNKEVRGITSVKASMDDVIRLFEDENLYEEWCHKCKTLRLIEKIPPEDRIIYYEMDLPWPLKDRDSFSYHQKMVNPDTKVIRYEIRDYSEKYPPTKGKMRVSELEGLWQFTPLSDGRVELYYEQYVDIGGAVPKWIVNQFVVEVPFQTLSKFRELIEQSLLSAGGSGKN